MSMLDSFWPGMPPESREGWQLRAGDGHVSKKLPKAGTTAYRAAERSEAAVEEELNAVIGEEYRKQKLSSHRGGALRAASAGLAAARGRFDQRPHADRHRRAFESHYASSVTLSRLLATGPRPRTQSSRPPHIPVTSNPWSLPSSSTEESCFPSSLPPCPPPRRPVTASFHPPSQQSGLHAPPSQPSSVKKVISCPDATRKRLPGEMFAHVFQFLDFRDLCRVAGVSRMWHASASADWLWRNISDNHKSEVQPAGNMTWKQAFAKFIDSVRSDLDDELADLKSIVRRSDLKLKQTLQQHDPQVPHTASTTHPTSSSSSSAASSSTLPAAQAPSPLSGQPCSAAVAAALGSQVAVLEHQMHNLKEQVGNIQQMQQSLENARREHEAKTTRLGDNARTLSLHVDAFSVAAQRRSFLATFERKVIHTCFASSDPLVVPVAIRRGTDTFSQMEIVALSVPPQGQPWAECWRAFKRLFPLSDAWWDVHRALTEVPPLTSDGRPMQTTVPALSPLVLPFKESSKHEAVLVLMVDILQTPVEHLLASFTGKPPP